MKTPERKRARKLRRPRQLEIGNLVVSMGLDRVVLSYLSAAWGLTTFGRFKNPKECRRFAAWLLKAALYLEAKEK